MFLNIQVYSTLLAQNTNITFCIHYPMTTDDWSPEHATESSVMKKKTDGFLREVAIWWVES